MGKIKLLLLSTFLFGNLAFACGSTMTYQNGGQTNTSSQCPSNTPSDYPGGSAPSSGPRGGPSAADMAAKAQAEREGCRQAVAVLAQKDAEVCIAEVDYLAKNMKLSCPASDGTLIWAFVYGGKTFSVIEAQAPVYFSQYTNTSVNSYQSRDQNEGCKAAVDIAAELTKSKCRTEGDNAVGNHCGRYN